MAKDLPHPVDPEPAPKATLRPVRWPEDLERVRPLFQDYRDWLADHRDPYPEARVRVASGLALIDSLIAGLPGTYGPPRGDVLLWSDEKGLVACGALREIEPGVGEGKRIYIRGDFRGPTFGRPFVRALLARAGELRYRRLRADTLPTMRAAIEFYQELGFRRVDAFWPHPVADAIFFEREVEPVASSPRRHA